MMFRRADRKMLGRMTFKQFNDFILPFSQEYAYRVLDRPEYYSRHNNDFRWFFNKETRLCFQNLWAVIFQGERQIEAIRQQAEACGHQINLRRVFGHLDTDRDDFVRKQELRDFLANNGFYATERELQGLVFRFDPDNKSRISVEQFTDGFRPVLLPSHHRSPCH